MSEAAEIVSEVTSVRHIQFPSGEIALGEDAIVEAIILGVYNNDQSVLGEVSEAVAQLFDALEEKNIEENADLEEYATLLQPGYGCSTGSALCPDCVEALEQDLDDERATVAALEAELDTLANFILKSVAGEPSQSQGAVDTAIRIIKSKQASLDHIGAANSSLSAALDEARSSLRIKEGQVNQLTIVNRTLNDELREAKKAKLNYPVQSIYPVITGSGGTSSYAAEAQGFRTVHGAVAPLTNPLPASFTLKNDVPTPYQAPQSGEYEKGRPS